MSDNDTPLPGLFAADLAAAATAGTLVAPIMVILDRAVVERMARGQPLLRSLWAQTKIAARRPLRFAFSRPFGIMWTLYTATYAAAGASDTAARGWLRTSSPAAATFAATTAVNVPVGIWKDVRFGQMFSSGSSSSSSGSGGSPTTTRTTTTAKTTTTAAASLERAARESIAAAVKSSPRTVPRAATATFLLRDFITIYGSITLPPRLSELLVFPGSDSIDGPAAPLLEKEVLLQLLVPVATQLLATPAHVVGMDMVQQQQQQQQAAAGWLGGVRARLARNADSLAAMTAMRCLRILPAFGVGIAGNQKLRRALHERVRPGGLSGLGAVD